MKFINSGQTIIPAIPSWCMLCSWGATYTLADGVLYVCGNNEGQCLRVSRSDAQVMRPMPWLMAYCIAVVKMKASACLPADRCTGSATYALADGIMYGCGNNEGQCLHVSRSDARGVRPMPWLMAYCMAVVTVKAGACGSVYQMHIGCNLCPGCWRAVRLW